MPTERRQENINLTQQFEWFKQDFNEFKKGKEKLAEKLDTFGLILVDLKIEVRESIAAYNAFIENTKEHNKVLCSKLDALSRVDETIFSRIAEQTEHCMARMPEYIEMKKHIADEKDNKAIFKDKKFRFLLLFSGAMLTFVFGFLLSIINDNNKKIVQEIKNEKMRYERSQNYGAEKK